LISLPMAQL